MKKPGFTLLEIMIVVGISVIIFGITAAALQSVLSNSRARTDQAKLIDQANRIIEYVVKTIRETSSSPTGAYPVVQASPTSFTFYSTISGSTLSRVRFFLDGSSLKQGIINPVGSPATYPAANEEITTILSNITTSGSPALFSYFDKNYTGSQSALDPITISAIRLVRVQFSFSLPNAVNIQPMTLALDAQLRNIKDNY